MISYRGYSNVNKISHYVMAYATDFIGCANKTALLPVEKRFERIGIPEFIEEVRRIIAYFLKLAYVPDSIYDYNKQVW